MAKIFKYIIAVIVIIYAASTLLYNSPNNYIKIKFEKELKIFDLFFNQRWGFFAPPPTFNNRLYYTFYDKNQKKIETFEVLQNLSEQKRYARPFNEREEMIDYLLNGPIIAISNYIPLHRDSILRSRPSLSDAAANKFAVEKISANAESLPGYAVLKNYSKEVAKYSLAKDTYKEVHYVDIKITGVPINKFTDRHAVNSSQEFMIIHFKIAEFYEENF
ncbi:hypothetical protein J8J42_12745 [Chryseobacterium sp. cx-311]|uniref:hypothetical protein n=1 Tax=Marnyiella aurantia TaxID=2758037 RepID=UPI001AEA0A91|nr:hypothetical protein [Marnyiella aurantia]MBP0613907.1 hypothetical protein [Marnyiella aurantia]